MAKHLKDVLKEKELLEEREGTIEFYDSKNSKEKEERFFKYLKGGIL